MPTHLTPHPWSTPGRPSSPAASGWHWIGKLDCDPNPLWWNAVKRQYHLGAYVLRPEDSIEMDYVYHGPAEPPGAQEPPQRPPMPISRPPDRHTAIAMASAFFSRTLPLFGSTTR